MITKGENKKGRPAGLPSKAEKRGVDQNWPVTPNLTERGTIHSERWRSSV